MEKVLAYLSGFEGNEKHGQIQLLFVNPTEFGSKRIPGIFEVLKIIPIFVI